MVKKLVLIVILIALQGHYWEPISYVIQQVEVERTYEKQNAIKSASDAPADLN